MIRLVSATGLALLCFTASAYGECAWVLWLMETEPASMGGNLTDKTAYRPLQSYANRTPCVQWIDVKERDMNAAKKMPGEQWQDYREAKLRREAETRLGHDMVLNGKPHTTEWLCFPDTVNPRGPKGK